MPEGIFCLKHMKKFLLAVLLVLIVLPAAYCFAASNNVVSTLDKVEIFKKLKFDAVFIGDDWKDSERWNKTESELSSYGIDVVYLPHTPDISSTELRTVKENKVSG